MSGFAFRASMTGSFRLHDAPGPAGERPMSLTVQGRSGRLWDFLRRPEVEIEGEVDAETFADHRYLRGRLGPAERRTGALPVAFEFTANDGRRYAFAGEETVRADDLVESVSVLPGAILDDGGAEVGRALLRFDLRSDLLRLLGSLRRAR